MYKGGALGKILGSILDLELMHFNVDSFTLNRSLIQTLFICKLSPIIGINAVNILICIWSQRLTEHTIKCLYLTLKELLTLF